jgi:SAM-dependent methyltransferase
MNRIVLPLKRLKLDVGCGRKDQRHGKDDYIGLDIKDYGQEIIWDMKNGIPLPDNSCINIFSSHFIEHFNDTIFFMNECWRILEPKGEIYIICPHRKNDSAYIPSHIKQLDEFTFKAFSYKEKKEWNEDNNIKTWEIKEIIVNNRLDIHFKAKPYGKN